MIETVSSTLTIQRPDWLLPIGVLALCLLACLVWAYRRCQMPSGWRSIAMGLKAIAILLMLVCLLQPMWRQTRPKPQANLFPVVIDNSRSMGLPRRANAVRSLLENEPEWLTRLGQTFDVHRYRFDEQLTQQNDDQLPSLTGTSSNLVSALQTIAARLQQKPIAGMLLMSDGNATDLSDDFINDFKRLGVPIYPVFMEDDSNWSDLSLADLSVSQTNFEASPITINGLVKATNMAGQSAEVCLIDPSGTVVERSTCQFSSDNVSEPIRFQFRPESSGIQFYQVAVASRNDQDQLLTAIKENDNLNTLTSSGEITLENNRQTVAVDRRSGPFRVLYVAGRPNWEFKFLRRAMQTSAEVELIGLLRIANKEPKFSFRAKGANGSNPLFAGLGEGEEETREQYDQPVMVRLGVKDADELSAGFPDTPEELFTYHAIVLDDIDADFFTQDQMLLLRRFVSVRGGGLLMLGGAESFDPNSFAKTPLGELSPVYLPSNRESNASERLIGRLTITREGMLQPWARLRRDSESEQQRLRTMPDFRTIHPVKKLKPGAVRVGEIEPSGGAGQGRVGQGESFAALVTQRFGRGRTAAMTIGDFWRWSMRANEESKEDPPQAWRQIIRWLVGEVPQRVEIQTESLDNSGRQTEVLVTVQNEAYLPEDNAEIDLVLESDAAEPLTIHARMDDDELGLYRATLRSRESGGHRVTANVRAEDGSQIGSSSTGWVYDPAIDELNRLSLNTPLLTTLAEATGGETVAAAKLSEFVDNLQSKEVDVMETYLTPLWHRPWMMLAAIACLCGEWGIRRWKGLA